MAEKKLIPANLDRTHYIKECDQGCFHVLCTRITAIPSDPYHPVRNSWVQCFEPQVWLKMLALKNDRTHPVDFQKAALINEYKVIHDPRIANNQNK
jgi:hypothetical protein